MPKENNLDNLTHRLNNMLDLHEHRTTGKSLYVIRREREKKEKNSK